GIPEGIEWSVAVVDILVTLAVFVGGRRALGRARAARRKVGSRAARRRDAGGSRGLRREHFEGGRCPVVGVVREVRCEPEPFRAGQTGVPRSWICDARIAAVYIWGAIARHNRWRDRPFSCLTEFVVHPVAGRCPRGPDAEHILRVRGDAVS